MRLALPGIMLLGVMATMNAHADGQEIRFTDKTLVAWVAVADLGQRGGAVLSLGGRSDLFDAIVFGEIAPRRWMAGSNFFARTPQDQSSWPEETAAPDEFVQMAIIYRGREVTILRNAEPVAAYAMGSDPVEMTTRNLVILGLRHLGAGNGYFGGVVEDARIYDRALTVAEVRALRPNEPSSPRPVGWWSFAGDSPDDQMGNFAPGTLQGGARIADGRLHLDGKSGCLITRRPVTVARAEGGWPRYHLTALPDEGVCLPYDANGCLYWQGRYHLMYIVQRADGGHCWGHASSPDLVNWTFHPMALEPMPGDPDSGIFSGNAFVNKEGVPMLCWFGIDAGVCVATAEDDDLIRWRKHPRNPIIPVPKEGEPGHGVYVVWDPYLWLEGDTYMCLLGGNRLPANRDTLYLCTSPDLVNWQPRHAFYEGDPAWRREDEDCSCPDFFRVGDRHVLMCISHAIGGRFYEGRFDAAAGVFHPEQHVRMNWPGGMYFAPESLQAPDGRRLFWAWVTDPRLRSAQEATGSGFQSLPRVLDFAADGTPLITPARELQALRRNHQTVGATALPADEEVTASLLRGAHVELGLELDPGQARQVGLKVRCAGDGSEETGIWYDAEAGVLRVDMARSTLRDDVIYGSPPFTAYGEVTAATPRYRTVEAPFRLAPGETLKLRVFVDGPLLEVFANDRQCVTQVLFPSRPDAVNVRLCATGGQARLLRAEAWDMVPLGITDARLAARGNRP